MQNKEITVTLENIELNYMFRAAKQDRQHLLVVFSAVSTDYNFIGTTSEGCRSNILWIKDDFDGESTYYLCKDNNFNIEPAVIKLINNTLQRLNLKKEQCTLMGFSKGGTAAIYYGLRYGFNNIIASCPQIEIGSYIVKDWPNVAKHMMGENYSVDEIAFLDGLIPTLLASDIKKERNIYIFSSPDDVQFRSEVEPYLNLFNKYDNFNFFFTESKLAWQHNKLTRYNLPLILSIVYSHGEGIYPKYGCVSNGASKVENLLKNHHSLSNSNEPFAISEIKKITISDNIIYPNGNSILKWLECGSTKNTHHTMILENKKRTYEFPLSSIKNNDLSYENYSGYYCNYSAGQFSSYNKSGIDISTLEDGTYKLKIKTRIDETELSSFAKSNILINISSFYKNKINSIYSDDNGVYLSITDVAVNKPSQIFHIKDHWIKGMLLHYEGVFAVKGIIQKEWSDSSYYLIAKSKAEVFIFKLGRSHKEYINEAFPDHYGCYQKSYFATEKYQGIDLSSIPNDTYNLRIALNKSGVIFESPEFDCIIKNGNNIKSTNHTA